MFNDILNVRDLPMMMRREIAKEYAAAARERNKPPCGCEACQMKELEPAVIQLTQRWKL